MVAALLPWPAQAEQPPQALDARELTAAERIALARDFVMRVSKGFAAADRKLQQANKADVSSVPDGEILFFRPRLDKRLWIEMPVMSVVEKGDILVSLRDFVAALQFPITITPEGDRASGWYIREKNLFNLEMKSQKVVTSTGEFTLSQDVRTQDGDIFVPAVEMEKWFGLGLNPNVSALEFFIESPIKLPVQEQLERRGRYFADRRIGPPVLPFKEDKPGALGVPFVDVSTGLHYRRSGDGKDVDFRQRASVNTSGDFAYGTLKTYTQLEREERLTNLRATYERESRQPDMLGPLNARRVKLGDVTPVNIPLNETQTAGVGARITNADPSRAYLRSSTEITGTAIPGWDVELFRENQLLAFRTVDENGVYRFGNVDLYKTNNNFRLIFYGPQGEIREEELYVPVDPKRLDDMGSAYDIALYGQNTQTYRKVEVEDQDRWTPNVTALYEVPVGDQTALSAGLSTRADNGKHRGTGYAGLSTSLGNTLLNVNTALDNKGESAAELVLRRDMGAHEVRNETRVATKGYGYTEPEPIDTSSNIFFSDENDEDDLGDSEVFGNKFSINGPSVLPFGSKPQYNLSLNYTQDADGGQNLLSSVGLSTYLKPVSVSQQFQHGRREDGDNRLVSEGDTLNSLTSVSGMVGRNRVRLLADYKIKPDSNLERVAASLQRNLTARTELDLGIQRNMQTKLTEGRGRVNWRTGFATISPGVTYNSERDLTATLNTRFGLSKDPDSGKVRMFDRNITSSGAVRAFVFLDKNGDNVFGEGDEPIPDVILRAPQNGGKELTDEEGYAFFYRMNDTVVTDVFIDEDGLPDPLWIPGFAGVSIKPRDGRIIPLDFPVHMAGEMDGTVYVRRDEENLFPLRSVRLGLYDMNNKKVMSTVSEADGFYLFTKIPPGAYYLNIDEPRLQDNLARPLPQRVNVGYDGTIIYANNVYVREGQNDVPITFVAEKPTSEEDSKELAGRRFALNLGDYSSRLTMGLAWFKARSLAKAFLTGANLVEKPSESLPDSESHKYSLRLNINDADITSAYKRCAEIRSAGTPCTLEILPGGMEQKVAAK